jgi:hypothetical protein
VKIGTKKRSNCSRERCAGKISASLIEQRRAALQRAISSSSSFSGARVLQPHLEPNSQSDEDAEAGVNRTHTAGEQFMAATTNRPRPRPAAPANS